jgi:hypothetical protein
MPVWQRQYAMVAACCHLFRSVVPSGHSADCKMLNVELVKPFDVTCSYH